MSKSLGSQLPPEVVAMLAGDNLRAGSGHTFTLAVTGTDGWPTFALLSVGEVLATDDETVRLALWPGSGMTAALTENGRATMMIVGGDSVWYVHLAARRGPDIGATGMHRAYFECAVDEVLVDKVTYAKITSGISFELPDPETVLGRWQQTIDLLRAAPPVPAAAAAGSIAG
jgi:hypothetical protein